MVRTSDAMILSRPTDMVGCYYSITLNKKKGAHTVICTPLSPSAHESDDASNHEHHTDGHDHGADHLAHTYSYALYCIHGTLVVYIIMYINKKKGAYTV